MKRNYSLLLSSINVKSQKNAQWSVKSFDGMPVGIFSLSTLVAFDMVKPFAAMLSQGQDRALYDEKLGRVLVVGHVPK